MIRRVLAVTFALLTLGLVSTASASTPTTTAAFTWVNVPGGLARSDCVHSIPKGANVAANTTIGGDDVTLGGTLVAHYDACPVAPTIPGTTAHANPTDGQVPQAAGGWVEGAQRFVSLPSGQDLDFITSVWYVPSDPDSDGGLVFLFNGIEPSGGAAIIQPVLQWGVSAIGGGNYWAIAPWYVDGGGHFAGPLETVSAADQINGYVFAQSQSGNNISWYNEIVDNTSGAYSWATDSSTGWQWTQAYVGILEAYNITECSQFPDEYIAYEFQDNYLYSSPGFTYNSDGGGFAPVQYAYSGSFTPSYQGPNCGFGQGYADSTWFFSF